MIKMTRNSLLTSRNLNPISPSLSSLNPINHLSPISPSRPSSLNYISLIHIISLLSNPMLLISLHILRMVHLVISMETRE